MLKRMAMYWHFSWLSFLLALTGVAYAEDILHIYQQAIEEDTELAVAEAKYAAVLEARPQAKSALLPQVNASAGIDYKDIRYNNASAIFNNDQYTQKTWGVRLDQSLFNKGNTVRLDQTDIRIGQAEAELNLARQAIIVRVAEAYFNTLAAGDNLEFARAEEAAILRQLKQTRGRFEAGVIAITDVRESEAQFDLAKAQTINAENQLAIAQESLHLIIGYTPQVLDVIAEDFEPTPPQPANIDEWVSIALENNQQLQIAGLGVELAQLEVERNRSDRLPTVGLKAEVGTQSSDGGFSQGDVTDATVGVEFRLPLFTSGRIQSQVAESQLKHKQAKTELELQKRNITRQVRAAYLNVAASISRIAALRQALKSTQTAADAAQAGFDVGTRTTVDVLLALRENYRAQRDYSRARYDYILDTFRLKQACGVLSGKDIEQVNELI